MRSDNNNVVNADWERAVDKTKWQNAAVFVTVRCTCSVHE